MLVRPERPRGRIGFGVSGGRWRALLPLAVIALLGSACGGQPTRATSTGTATAGTTVAATSATTSTSGTTTGTGSTGPSTTSGGVTTTTGGTTGHATGTTGGGGCGFPGTSCQLPDFDTGLCCNGTCIDFTSDDHNCNGCGLACPTSQSCIGETCLAPNCDGQPIGTPCAGNLGSVDLSHTCSYPGVGRVAICVAVVATCDSTSTGDVCDLDAGLGVCCGTTCSDLGDPANCDRCGLACPAGADCTQASCDLDCRSAACATGSVCAQGPVGYACAAAVCDSALAGLACALDAGVGSCCGDSCVNPQSDPANCALCGHACGPSQYCQDGDCVPNADCTAEEFVEHACGLPGGGDGLCCGGSCQAIDIFDDPMNCGGCALACPSTPLSPAFCGSQNCLDSSGSVAVSCEEPDETCPLGFSCGPFGCLLSACDPLHAFDACTLASDPEILGTCCGTGCVDFLSDQNNCGQCGAACPTGTFCDNGACTPIEACSPQIDGPICPIDGGDGVCCRGSCADLLKDSSNCGRCGVACPTGQRCQLGECTVSDGGTGCTAGGCPTGTLCQGSLCLPSPCPPQENGLACAFGGGDGVCCAGACVDLTTDPANCGSCGSTCAGGVCYSSIENDFGGACLPLPTGPCATDCGPAGLVCIDGYCIPGGCSGPPGQACAFEGQRTGVCCGANVPPFSTSTCTDFLNDPANCGGCEIACPVGQTCAQGACSGDVAPCLAGSQDRYCALDAGFNWVCCAGGGCTNLATDPNNCGGCGTVCPEGYGCFLIDDLGTGGCLVTTCSAATEEYGCNLGGGLEGMCCNTGCVDTATDPSNCGDCTVQCDGGQSCHQGICG